MDSRSDIVRFRAAPLPPAVDVGGRVTARFRISSAAPDTDFAAKLIDVHPDGFALGVADGVLRMRHRNGRDKSEAMTRGQAHEAVIDLRSVSNLFAAGHRIRIDVSSSNYPRIAPNPNTGENPWTASKPVKPRNSVYHDTLPSYVELPIRPCSRRERYTYFKT